MDNHQQTIECSTCCYSKDGNWWAGDLICTIPLPPWIETSLKESKRHVNGWDSCSLWKEKDSN